MEIAATPDGIDIPEDLSDLLARLGTATGGALRLISGRSVEDLERFLPDYRGDIHGGHGAEARLDGQRDALGEDVLAAAGRVRDAVRAVADRTGLRGEYKATGAVLHYRDDPARQAEARAEAEAIVRDEPEFEVHAAKMAWEIKPESANKGHAAERALAAWPGRIPVMIGDDTTDEDAMRVVNAAGGLSIRVGGGPTLAQHHLRDPAAVHDMLRRWLKESET